MLIQCDASQLEWRTALQLSGDTIGLAEILEGQDTHALNQTAFDLPSRLIAKIFLFRTIFRGSGWSFANDPDFMHVSSKATFWDDMNAKFYGKYQGLDHQHQVWAATVMDGKPIEGPFGRSWYIKNRTPTGEVKVPWTTLTNYPVQGTGADIMMLARIMAHTRIKKEKIPCDFISTVHDSIVLDTHNDCLGILRSIFDSVFADLPREIKKIYGYDWVVPMACETKAGKNMREMVRL